MAVCTVYALGGILRCVMYRSMSDVCAILWMCCLWRAMGRSGCTLCPWNAQGHDGACGTNGRTWFAWDVVWNSDRPLQWDSIFAEIRFLAGCAEKLRKVLSTSDSSTKVLCSVSDDILIHS